MRTSMIACGMVALMSWLAGPLASQTPAPTAGHAVAHPATPSTAVGTAGAASAAGKAQRGVQAQPLERIVSLDLENVHLNDALKEINRQARLGLAYTPRVVPVDKRVTIEQDSITAGEALDRVLRGTGTKAIVTEAGTVMLVKEERRVERADTAVGAIFGQVTDADTKAPLEGATITVKGTELRAVANVQGWYGIPNVPAGVQTIVARSLGYRVAERRVLVVDSQTVMVNFGLEMGMTRLQEVVATATGPRRRVELGNDITVINADSIARTQPITSVTDLLEGRVPGLVVQRTSGAPGDPARLRLRGASSVYLNNDPIIVIDGVRVYAAQSDVRGQNFAMAQSIVGGSKAAPSPLDQIDVSSIQTIEVLKGPSAATLYGPDAASGVIVVTTKRGEVGPPRWTASAEQGLTYMPGRYPDGYFAVGHRRYEDGWALCLNSTYASCAADSVVRYQLLNDPEYSVLGHGRRTAVTLGVSGGVSGLTYAVNGRMADETGLLTLPDADAQRYQQLTGTAPPAWMRRPQSNQTWSGTGRLSAELGTSADISFTSMLTRQEQQRSSLEGQLATLMGTYVDPRTGTYFRNQRGLGVVSHESLASNYFQRATDVATNLTVGTATTWRPSDWLTTGMNAGINVISRQDELYQPQLPFGLVAGSGTDSGGTYNTAHLNSLVTTINPQASVHTALGHGFDLRVAVGANYQRVSTADLGAYGTGLSAGSQTVAGAGSISVRGAGSDQATFGWYVEPAISHKRFWLSTGIRMDGGNTYGAQVKLVGLPKVNASWLLSDEPFFPDVLKRVVGTLRLRGAYGQAGTQPGAADRLRIYRGSSAWLNSRLVDVAFLSNLGNTELRPERSSELEGGLDANLLGDRVFVQVTGYRKVRNNALIQVPLPSSVAPPGGRSVWKNVGTIRNSGVELGVTAELLRNDLVAWSMGANLTRNQNVVVSLAPGVEPFYTNPKAFGGTRVAPGYPLFGLWARPIMSYADVNGDGMLDPSEVQLGDTAAYMGGTMPNYQTSLHTTLALFRRRLTVDAGFNYTDGMTQTNLAFSNNPAFVRGLADPNAPLAEQAAAVAALNGGTPYGFVQTVSTFRFNSLSVSYRLPDDLAQRLGMRALSVAVQGTNLGMHSNYRGKDPDVNANTSGNEVADTGILPQPRTWQLRLSAAF